jgi:preprotein translocase subunit Sss1
MKPPEERFNAVVRIAIALLFILGIIGLALLTNNI